MLNTCKDSAPGPDGIPFSFYKHFWGVFGGLIVDSANESISNGLFLDSQRQSYLRLIPKEGKDSTLLKNWRPITLSNCDYKLVTKCYARRLTAIFEDKITTTQTAYLPNRQIQDNIRLANIAITQGNGLLVSADGEKAFDSLAHINIEMNLRARGLGKFVKHFQSL